MIRRVLKSCAIAFSAYSKIPMPQFEWREEDMRYALCFFPLVGVVIGCVLWGFLALADMFGLGEPARSLIGAAIPLLVTGGFHLDGFMDVADARHSYGDREKKLEILKDPHIGAFSVIQTLVCGAVYISAFSEIREEKAMAVLLCSFTLARALSGLCLVFLQAAKKDGILATFAGAADRMTVRGILLLTAGLTAGFMLGLEPVAGGLALVAAGMSMLYYAYVSKKEFGGITGDLAGFFVVICETAMAVAIAIGCRL